MRIAAAAAFASLSATQAFAAALSQSAGPPPPAPSIWALEEAGAAHRQTGLVCPPVLGGYRRYSVTAFDNAGYDVSCGYNDGRGVAITAYLSRADHDVADPLARAKNELSAVWAAKHPVSSGADEALAEADLTFTVARYRLDDDVMSEIWLADLHGWRLKYRITYPEAARRKVETLRGLLSTQVRASAATHLDVCAKSTAPTREGGPLKGAEARKEAATLSAILGSSRISASQEKGEVLDDATRYCLEEDVQIGAYAFQTWRGVNADGGDAHIDRITALNVAAFQPLYIRRDSLAEAVDPKVRAWTATIEAPAAADIYDYYDGRPSTRAAAELLAAIFDGKAKPLIGYSVDNKTVTLNMPDGE